MMTQTSLPLQSADISTFARNLHRQLSAEAGVPSHLTLLNMLARSAGYRNFQHLRAQTASAARLAKPLPQADLKRVETALRFFDAAGQMTNWPSKTNLQHLCMWALWSRLPAQQTQSEREISALLNTWHLFGDAAILRRTLVELGLICRTVGGNVYTRAKITPPPDAAALIRHLHSGVPR
jgi:hypothetical protein